MTPAVLEVRGLTAGYTTESDILHDVSIAVPEGGFVSVIGPNGAGKSTLLKAIYGIVRPRAGGIVLRRDGGDVEIARRRPHRITALGMNYVPQLANVFPRMTVYENLEIGATPLRERTGEPIERVLDLFPVLRERRRQRAETLSGGQRQMLALARALVPEPRLLLLDEPSAGLAPKVVDELFVKLREISGMGVAVLMVEQNARRSLAMSDYAYVLDMGRNRYSGAGPDLLHDDNVIELYLGGRGRLGTPTRPRRGAPAGSA